MNQDPFPITIVKKGPFYYGVVRELSLIEKGTDLSQVYDTLEARQNDSLRQLRETNIYPFFTKEPKKRLFSPIHLAIVALFLTIPLLSVAHPLAAFLSRSKAVVEKVMAFSTTDGIVKLSNKIERMPEAKKKELREAFHSIAVELQPFLTELSTLNQKGQEEIENQSK